MIKLHLLIVDIFCLWCLKNINPFFFLFYTDINGYPLNTLLIDIRSSTKQEWLNRQPVSVSIREWLAESIQANQSIFQSQNINTVNDLIAAVPTWANNSNQIKINNHNQNSDHEKKSNESDSECDLKISETEPLQSQQNENTTTSTPAITDPSGNDLTSTPTTGQLQDPDPECNETHVNNLVTILDNYVKIVIMVNDFIQNNHKWIKNVI